MNCNPKNRRGYLTAKMLGWRELASCGIDSYERARGRKNLRQLVREHPEIAGECGMSLHTWRPTLGGTDAKN